MKQKMLIEVNAEKPLNEYNETHVLLYDGIKKQYFVKSRDELLSSQNTKIKELEAKIDLLKKENDKFKNELTQKFASFLETYQETNNEIIQMVKSLMEEN